MMPVAIEQLERFSDEGYTSPNVPLRICLVCSLDDEYSMLYVANLAKSLASNNHAVNVIGSKDIINELSQTKTETNLLELSNTNRLKYTNTLKNVRSSLAKFKPDIVNTFDDKASKLIKFAGIGLKFPIVKTHLQSKTNTNSVSPRKMIGEIYASSLIQFSESKIYKTDENTFKLIRLGLYSPSFRQNVIEKSQARKLLEIKESDIVIAHFSNCENSNNLEFFNNAKIELLNNYGVSIKSLLISESISSNTKEPSDYQITAKTEQEIAVALSAADLCLFSDSSSPATSRRISQSMMAMLPVVGARVGIIPEIIGSTGIMYNPTNHKELAKAINHLLSKPYEYKRSQILGLRRMKNKFSLERQTQLTLSFYNDVISYYQLLQGI